MSADDWARTEHSLVVVARFPFADTERLVVICPDCAAGHARFRAWSRLPDEARDVAFDRLTDWPEQAEALQATMAFVQEPVGWLTLAGGYGTGKTTLIYAALNHLAAVGSYGAYWTAPDLIEELRSGLRDETGAAHSDRLARIAELPVLAIDELDKYRHTAFAEEGIFRLFQRRYQLRRTHATLIGYNLDGADCIPPFLRSRIGDGRFRLVEMPGVDLRPALGGVA